MFAPLNTYIALLRSAWWCLEVEPVGGGYVVGGALMNGTVVAEFSCQPGRQASSSPVGMGSP